MRLRDLLVLPLYVVGSVFVIPLVLFVLLGIPRLSDLKQQVTLQQKVYRNLLKIKDLRVELSQNLLSLEFRGGRFFYDQMHRHKTWPKIQKVLHKMNTQIQVN